MVTGPASIGGSNSRKAEISQVEGIDKGIGDTPTPDRGRSYAVAAFDRALAAAKAIATSRLRR
jgi:hypothetical protein